MGDMADFLRDQEEMLEHWDLDDSYGSERYAVHLRNKERRKTIMKVKGIAMWCSVQSPNTTFDPVYQTDLIVSEEAANALKNLGLKVTKTDDGWVHKFKRNQFRPDGSENNKPVVRDANNEPFGGLIGNGSEVIVQFSTYEWSNKFGSGMSSDLQGVQVINLVSYRAADGEEFEPVDGEVEEVIGGDSTPTPPKAVAFDDDVADVL